LNTVLDIKNSSDHEFKSFLDGALYWFSFGFDVIPLLPKDKVTAVKWDGWLESLSEEKIIDHWTKHPDHEVGFIVGDDFIVLDADTPESTAKLYEIEEAFDVSPKLIVTTSKGEHHYFNRPVGVFAKSDSHSTVDHPDRLDVKTGRAMVVSAPSTGKEVDICEVDSADELTEVDQSFVDAVARHNGRPVPRPQQPREISVASFVLPTTHKMLATILSLLPADCGYEDWLQTMMAIYHETGGSDEGLILADSWSSNGRSYKGKAEVELKWRSFKSGVANPITVRSLAKKLDDQGIDWMGLCSENEDSFEVCEEKVEVLQKKKYQNMLEKFSLKGMLRELESLSLDNVYVLHLIALLGQLTVIYAAPNSGKTLLVLWMLIEAIKNGNFDASNLYYINVDDDQKGLIEKLRLAEEYDFHIISDVYNNFDVDDLLSIMLDMIDKSEANGAIIVLDTLKKFTDLMDKRKSTQFTKVARQFALKGGTLIALAHTNKNPNSGGKSVYGGTNDIMCDFDCAYNLDILSNKDNENVVVFENKKKRGNVINSIAFSYSTEDCLTYPDLFSSVKLLENDQVVSIKKVEEQKSDAELIMIVEACILEGITTKMKLRDATVERIGVSRRKALNVIEKYTGEDADSHRWSFTKGNHGAQNYNLLHKS